MMITTIPYTVNETERAVVYWGISNPYYEEVRAGLRYKLPFPIQSVKLIEKRIMILDAEPSDILTTDKKTMLVDTFAFYKINDGVRYSKELQTEENAKAQVESMVYSETRNSLASRSFENILVKERKTIMDEVTATADGKLQPRGINVADILISKTDLPHDNKESVYARMRKERERQAKTYRSEGNEEAKKITSLTDKEVAEVLSEADKIAAENKGEGNREAARIYNEVYGSDPEFYTFYRGLIAAQKTLANSKWIMRGDEPHIRALFGKMGK